MPSRAEPPLPAFNHPYEKEEGPATLQALSRVSSEGEDLMAEIPLDTIGD